MLIDAKPFWAALCLVLVAACSGTSAEVPNDNLDASPPDASDAGPRDASLGDARSDATPDATPGDPSDAAADSPSDATVDPCSGVTCTAPDANRCEDATQLRVFEHAGVCASGACSYASTLHACAHGCENGQCKGDPCVGVTCASPQANRCENATQLRVFEQAGVCANGTCSYASSLEACAFGCANGRCNGDPCVGVTCASPEANRCENATQLRVFEQAGVCANGTCSYASALRACAFGCEGGRCKDDPCSGVTCASPEASRCDDASHVRVFEATGVCSAGACSYASSVRACAFGCESGRCKDDPCVGVTCSTPDANRCEDATHVRVFQSAGACANGTCSYTSTLTACPFGCESGRCKGDPCTGVSCNAPEANRCEDATRLRVFNHAGVCANGACSYTSTLRACAFGCEAGACKGDPCAGVTCSTPEADRCDDATHARHFISAGVCAGGACSYTATVQACDFGCDGGRCKGAPSIAFTSAPTSGTANVALPPVAVSVLAGTVVDTTFAGAVTLSLATTPPTNGAVLRGTLTTDAINGVATFGNVTIDRPGTYALVATAGTLAVTSAPFTIRASVGAWQSANGVVTGGNIRSLAISPVNPDTVYAAANSGFPDSVGGLYVTSNATSPSAAWSLAGLPNGDLRKLVVDGSGALFAIGGDRGDTTSYVRRSTDGGKTWTSLASSVVTASSTNAFAIDPSNSATLYLGTDAGLFKTTTGGGVWAPILPNPTSNWGGINAVAVAPSNPQFVYAALSDGAIQRSTDGGSTWTVLPAIPQPLSGTSIDYGALAVSAESPGTVYASRVSGELYVYDGGLAWRLVPGRPRQESVNAIVLNAVGKWSYTTSYRGVMRSADGGATWTSVGTFSAARDVAVDPSNSSTAYVSINAQSALGGQIVFRTTDAGITWTNVSAGIHAFDATVAVAPSDPSIVYVGATNVGLYRSGNRAQTWDWMRMWQSYNWGALLLGVSPTHPNVLYAGSTDGIFKYADSLQAGVPTKVLVETYPNALVVSPVDEQTVFASFERNLGGLFTSKNGGGTWSDPAVRYPGAQWVYPDPHNVNVAYALVTECCGSGGGALVKTTNQGATWQQTSLLNNTEHFIKFFAIDPTSSQHLFVACDTSQTGLLESTDGGATFNAVLTGATPWNNLRSFVIDPRSPSTLYAGAGGYSRGLYRSTDSGRTWGRIGLDEWIPISIAIDPVTPTNMYVGVEGGGVFKTTTGGL